MKENTFWHMNLLLSTLAENACTVLKVFGRMFSSGTSELKRNMLDEKLCQMSQGWES